MRRWSVLSIVAASVSACHGGAGSVGRESVEHERAQARATPTLHEATRAATRDPAPSLVTVQGRNTAPVAVTPTVAPMGTPPAGGYIVRGTGVRATAAPPPPSAPVTEASPTPVVATRAPADHEAASPPRVVNTAAPGHRGGDTRVALETLSERPVRGRSSGHAYGMGHGAAGAGGGGEAIATGAMGPRARHHSSSSGGASEGYGGLGDGLATSDSVAMSAPMGAAAPPTAIAPAAGPITVSVTVHPAAPAPTAPPTDDDAQATAGLLTAASVADADRRTNYLEYLSRHTSEASDLGLDMSRRVRFRVTDAQGHPVNDARISLSGDGVQFVGRTHADGSFDYFPSLEAPAFSGALTATADVEQVGAHAVVDVPATGDAQGPITLALPAVVAAPTQAALDLGFVIDVTGSMGDELRYVNREVASIVQRVEQQAPGVNVRVSATFYRDRVDELVVQQIPFTDNVPAFASVMLGVTAGGGGDYPEDMNAGLEAAMTRLSWSDGPAVRVMVLIADAPPQPYADESFTYRQAMETASRRGIRILPVAASGADRTVEYLFRAMGAMTSTPYVYLTDDSGVGAPHMEADTDRVAVERFNDLLTRLLISDLHGQGMHEPGPLGEQG